MVALVGAFQIEGRRIGQMTNLQRVMSGRRITLPSDFNVPIGDYVILEVTNGYLRVYKTEIRKRE